MLSTNIIQLLHITSISLTLFVRAWFTCQFIQVVCGWFKNVHVFGKHTILYLYIQVICWIIHTRVEETFVQWRPFRNRYVWVCLRSSRSYSFCCHSRSLGRSVCVGLRRNARLEGLGGWIRINMTNGLRQFGRCFVVQVGHGYSPYAWRRFVAFLNVAAAGNGGYRRCGANELRCGHK